MKEGGCEPGTQSTYLGYLSAGVKRNLDRWTDAEYQIISRFRKAADKEYARTKKEKTIVAAPGLANTALQKLTAGGKVLIAIVLYLMGVMGGRYSDIVQLQYRDIEAHEIRDDKQNLTGYEFEVHYRTGKNRPAAKYKHWGRDTTEKTLLNLPLGARVFFDEVRQKKMSDPEGYPFQKTNTSQAGAALRNLGLGLTTYSFRKHYTARVYAELGDKKKVAERMGHANPKMTEAFYMSMEMMPVVRAYREKFGWDPKP
jgi:integrase